jgi:membrane fusion protein (multidrug efflux system)
VEGLHPGTGSIFALLPPENASGNYIHVVERLPVRIALHPEDLKQRPLRPGLSTLTRIDVTHPGNGLGSSTTTAGPGYATSVYRHELDRANALVEEIIRANVRDSSAPLATLLQ